MIIVDKPFVSEEIKAYLDQSQIAVLKNEMAYAENCGHHFNLVEQDEFIHAVKNGQRLYTLSENSIQWIYQNISDERLISCIMMMKDKVKFRLSIKRLYPDVFFREVALEDLKNIDLDALPMPFVIKPSIGFFSIGVYTITNRGDWNHAIQEIFTNYREWKNSYTDSVVGNSTFILEEYISGEEYAIDAYYDENGMAVILNIMKHDFTSASDVSDRLYYTGKEIIEGKMQLLTDFLNKVNEEIEAADFPFHAEVRIDADNIIPIEFNPMRFAGWCCTDLTYFAFGFKTYDYYMRNIKPDWNELLYGKENKLFSVIVLDKHNDFKSGNILDYEELSSRFHKVLCIRKLDPEKHPVFGFMFTETDGDDRSELDNIVRSDLKEFYR